TAVIVETTPVQMPIRGAALKQILKSIDPPVPTETEVKEEVKEEQPTPRRMPNRKAKRPSTAKAGTPKPPPNKVVYRDTPPSSPEPEEKPKKPKKSGGGQGNNLLDLLNEGVKPKRKYVRKTPKKKAGKWSDEDTDEEKIGGNTKWYDGDVTPKDLDINKLRFKKGSFFIGLYKIIHLISIDESKGATYVVYRNKYELILRVNFIQRDDMEQLNTELKFLEMMELNSAQHFFSTIFDLGYVNKHQADGVQYYAYIYRGGPTIERCHSICDRKVSPGSLDRIAGQIVKIFEQLCGHGYRLLSFSLEDFNIDARSRNVYLSNHTDIVKVYDREETVDVTDPTERRRTAWEGSLDFAPIKWHQLEDAHMMSERDTVESLIYMLIYMHKGALPWSHGGDKLSMKMDHSEMGREGALINDLPPSLKCLWVLIRSSDASDVNFDLVHRIVTRYSDESESLVFDWESPVGATEEQQKLINMYYAIDDMQKQMAVMQCIFDNEELLTLR
ncbi:hypothetical protein PMAYCL1PPCAC_31559, partial [Pristionchus mayeri]